MRKLSTVLFLFFSVHLLGQVSPAEQARPIVEEGKRLYKSEMASWYGTDLFIEVYKDKANIGGYFSYSDNGIAKCIFFSKSDKPRVIGSISFDSTYNTKTATTDLAERDFTSTENDLYAIRNIASITITTDTMFKTYKNTSLNLIPLINGGEKKVYVLTGPQQSGMVIFGNDYLLTFDKENKLVAKKQLHKNIIPISYTDKLDAGKEIEGTIHSHLPGTGDFITATDICTLMLYEKFTKWKQHNVVSGKYLNIWDCLTDKLTIIPMETVNQINKDQEMKNERKQKGG